jgi:hypothetical protein
MYLSIDRCWYCPLPVRMTRSHVLLHPKMEAARERAWDKQPGSVRMLLANPRWRRRPLRFLEESGVGRIMENGEDENEIRAARMDGWIAWGARRRAVNLLRSFCFLLSFVSAFQVCQLPIFLRLSTSESCSIPHTYPMLGVEEFLFYCDQRTRLTVYIP